jgi:CRP/FNR family cyclic AMP-dependent transcriptional regulator
MTDQPDAATVRAVTCLSELTGAEAAAAASRFVPRRLAPGEVLFRQGDPGDSVYVLASGEVEVRVAGADGEHHLATIAAGTFIGEFAVLADEVRTRSVVGRTEAQLWEVTRGVFEDALGGGEPWASRFLMAIARELARQMLAVDQQLVALMEDGGLHDEPVGRVRELEKLRRQLSGEWSF